MTRRTHLRAGHGTGAGQPRVEVVGDELPKPVAAPPAASGVTLRFRKDGKFADSATARALGSLGGEAKAAKRRLIDGLGIGELADDAEFKPFEVAAEELRSHHVTVLAGMAGGVCGPAPSTMVASACLQLAASRFLFGKGAKSGDVKTLKAASALADASRQNLLAAYSNAVLEAESRKQSHAGALPPWFVPTNEETK